MGDLKTKLLDKLLPGSSLAQTHRAKVNLITQPQSNTVRVRKILKPSP